MRVYVALWKYPDEEYELSVHETENGAIKAIEEEVSSFCDDDFFSKQGFDPQEYEDLLLGEMLGFDDDDDKGTLWVGIKIQEVVQ